MLTYVYLILITSHRLTCYAFKGNLYVLCRRRIAKTDGLCQDIG